MVKPRTRQHGCAGSSSADSWTGHEVGNGNKAQFQRQGYVEQLLEPVSLSFVSSVVGP